MTRPDLTNTPRGERNARMAWLGETARVEREMDRRTVAL